MSDSIPLEQLRRRPTKSEYRSDDTDDTVDAPAPRIRVANYKLMVALFVVFLVVVSDVFTDSVISKFGSAVKGRDPTSWGIMLQGIFLVLGYIMAVYLTEHGVL